MSIKLSAFQAQQGDSLLLSYDSMEGLVKNIVIDAGLASSYHRTLRTGIIKIIEKGQRIDLAIISHHDNDHIQGFIPLLIEFGIEQIDQFWFNYYPESFSFPDPEGAVGIKEGIQVRDYILKNSKLPHEGIYVPHSLTIGDALLTIISPTKSDMERIIIKWLDMETELATRPVPIGSSADDKHLSIDNLVKLEFNPDRSQSNNSSIAFLFSHNAKSLLFTADASARTLADSITNMGFSVDSPLNLDLMQIPHHGSSANTSSELLSLISCRNFLVSTNPINSNNFPHKATFARIVNSAYTRNTKEPIIFNFNYDHPSLRTIFTFEEIEKYHIECIFPSGDQNGIFLEI